MEIEELVIVPTPKKMVYKPGKFVLKACAPIVIPCEDKHNMFHIGERLQSIIKASAGLELPVITNDCSCSDFVVFFEKVVTFKKEQYIIGIDKAGISVKYGSQEGAFHAVSTLKQIVKQCGKAVPFLKLEDWPDFEVRGIMQDISRNKIPTMDTLYKLVDFMADLKLNHFQLYIEGFSYGYTSFPEVWSDGTPVIGEEMRLLDRYCKERFIEFVPNQNSFGHMTPWLQRREFNHLAICPDGCEAPWGKYDMPIALNPLDEGSIELLEKMYGDLLPYFSSQYFNVGCDETFDLGQGKSREQCVKLGKGRVYLDFLMKIYEVLKKQGRKMMFWGDIIVKYPELISELPKDIIALEWGYNPDQPCSEDCEKFERSGIKYYVCPGTRTWNSITGFTGHMKSNLLNAAIRGKEHGASGYLNTDWGEGGHWHTLPVSYASFCYGAALSWGVEQNIEVDIAAYLNRFVFKDENNKMGRFVLELGNYYLMEKETVYDGSGIFRTLYYEQLNVRDNFLAFLNLPDIEQEDYRKVKAYISNLYADLNKVEMKCEDAGLVEAEFKASMRLLLHGANLGLFKLDKSKKLEERRKQLEELYDDITQIIEDYKSNWLKRNRSGGLDKSTSRMENLKNQYFEALLGGGKSDE